MSDQRAGSKGRRSGLPQNLVGPQVRRLRAQQRLTQPALAAKCQIAGYDLSRESLAKIEARLRSVTDAEVVLLASALRVPYTVLYPPSEEMAAALRPFLSVAPKRGTPPPAADLFTPTLAAPRRLVASPGSVPFGAGRTARGPAGPFGLNKSRTINR